MKAEAQGFRGLQLNLCAVRERSVGGVDEESLFGGLLFILVVEDEGAA